MSLGGCLQPSDVPSSLIIVLVSTCWELSRRPTEAVSGLPLSMIMQLSTVRDPEAPQPKFHIFICKAVLHHGTP